MKDPTPVVQRTDSLFIIALLNDAMRELYRAQQTENKDLKDMWLDCARIYVNGAIKIAGNHMCGDFGGGCK